jgi:hypothetical protein
VDISVCRRKKVFREAALVIGRDGEILYRHVPADRGVAALPDSRTLWDFYFENYKKMSGQVHSHPGTGWPSPSHTDITTYAACEQSLGRRYFWWIASEDKLVLVTWAGPGRHDYGVQRVEDEPPWVAELRRLSRE